MKRVLGILAVVIGVAMFMNSHQSTSKSHNRTRPERSGPASPWTHDADDDDDDDDVDAYESNGGPRYDIGASIGDPMRRLSGQLHESARLDKACEAAGRKPSNSACKQLEQLLAKMKADGDRMEAIAGAIKGRTDADAIRNNVRTSERTRQYREDASRYREQARYWDQQMRQAYANGDRNAAQAARENFNYYQQKANEYGGNSAR